MVNDILDVSLLESNEIELNEDTVNVNNLLDALYLKYKDKLENAGSPVKLILKNPEKQLTVKGDQERLRQVISSLLDNAVKFTNNGSITFGAKEENDKNILFFVEDTGIGIDIKYHKLLFERFYKVEDKKDILFRGTGIGLYLCKRIIDMMQGKIWVESELGKGSCFYFIIPKNLEITKKKSLK